MCSVAGKVVQCVPCASAELPPDNQLLSFAPCGSRLHVELGTDRALVVSFVGDSASVPAASVATRARFLCLS